MVVIQNLIKAEEDVMTMVGHIVWSFEDTCSSCIFTEFYRPLHHERRRRMPVYQHNNNAAIVSQQDKRDDKDASFHDEDTLELLKQYYQQTMMQVSEFTETILYSILFMKWAEARNDGDGTIFTITPGKWKDSLPNHLRRATRQKANRIICSLMGITRLRLEALDLVYDALHRAERLASGYVQRKSDHILSLSTRQDEQKAALDRLEEDAIKYVNRQIATQLKVRRQHANRELFNAMTDIIDASIENEQYCQRLHKWAQATVALSNLSQWNTSSTCFVSSSSLPQPKGDSSSETSATESVEESHNSAHSPSSCDDESADETADSRQRDAAVPESSVASHESPIQVIYI